MELCWAWTRLSESRTRAGPWPIPHGTEQWNPSADLLRQLDDDSRRAAHAAEPVAEGAPTSRTPPSPWSSTTTSGLRVLDGIEPEVIDRVRQEAAAVPGVLDVENVRARWLGHTIRPEVTLTLAGDETVAEAGRIVHAVGHRLTDHIDFVADPAIRTSAQRT